MNKNIIIIIAKILSIVVVTAMLNFIPVAAHTIGTGGSAWAGNSTMNNVTEDNGDHNVKIGIFADNFEDNNLNGWTTTGGSHTVSNGVYKQQTTAASEWVTARATDFTYTSSAVILAKVNVTDNGTYLDEGLGWGDSTWNFTTALFAGRRDEWNQWELKRNDVLDNNDISSRTLNEWSDLQLFKKSDGYNYVSSYDNIVMTTLNSTTNSQYGYLLGSSEIVQYWDDVRIIPLNSKDDIVTSGNFTTWYEGENETYRIDVNAITPPNTNYTVWYRQNGTSEFLQVGGVYTDNNTIALSPGYQNTDVRIVLNGNQIATPVLISIMFYTQSESTVPSYGVSLTNISALTHITPTGTNATYLLNLANTGTAPDSYYLTIDNPDNAQEGLNIITPYPLNVGETKIITLNVTSTTPGTYSVNVTATSQNDPTKVGHIDTTTIITAQAVVPAIISWSNNKKNGDATSLTINVNEAVRFNATADQSISAWNWFKDGVLQDNNYDNFSTSWSTPGIKTVSVYAVDEKGKSKIVTWTVSVKIKNNPVELPKLSKTAPYSDIPVQGTPNWGDTDREFIQAGHNDRIRQNGTIYQIQFAVADASKLTQFNFTVWRKNGNNYDRIATTNNLIDYISDGINVINLPHPIENIQEGDFYGYRIKASDDALYVDTGVTNHKTYYTNGGATSFQNYDWAVNPISSHVFVIEPYMENTYMVFIGDSIISGVTTWTDTHYSFIETTDITNIPISIENQWTRKVDRSYQNMGLAGDRTSGINNRFNSDVVDLSPEFVLIEGGINDVNGGLSNELILANWNSMIQKAYNNNITPVIMLILPVSRYDRAIQIDYLNEELIKMSKIYSPSIVVDATCYVGIYRDGGPLGNCWDINPSYTYDGLHYNAAGTERIAQAIKDSFIYVYGKPGLYNFVQSDGTVLYSMNLSYAKNTYWRMASTSGAANVSYNTPSSGELANITINSGTIDWFNIGNISSNPICYLKDSNGVTIESKGVVNKNVNFTTDLLVGSYCVQCSATLAPLSDTASLLADAGSDQTVNEDTVINFNGSGSHDTEGIVSYSWDFDNSNGITADATNVTTTHTYPNPGTYTVTLNVSDAAGNFDEDILIVTVNAVTTTKSSSGGSSGSNGTSGETFENILCNETDCRFISKDHEVSFNFELECNYVKYINFTSLSSFGIEATKVEILNHTSSLVSMDAPDIVFTNLNVWIGSMGLMSENNVENPTISFYVDKSWVEDNGITLNTIYFSSYDDSIKNWEKMPTQKIGEDSNSYYFKASLPLKQNIGSFAISGRNLSSPSIPLVIPIQTGTVQPTQKNNTTITPITWTSTWKEKVPPFQVFSAFFVIISLYIVTSLAMVNIKKSK